VRGLCESWVRRVVNVSFLSHVSYTLLYKVCARKIILGLNWDVPLLVLLCGGIKDMVGLLFEKWYTNFIIGILKNYSLT
jgi:hypothetical protein